MLDVNYISIKLGIKYSSKKKKKSSLTTSGWDLIFNLEGWDEVESGKEIQEGGDVCVPMADSCWCMAEITQYCKSILQLKIKFKKEQYTLSEVVFLLRKAEGVRLFHFSIFIEHLPYITHCSRTWAYRNKLTKATSPMSLYSSDTFKQF